MIIFFVSFCVQNALYLFLMIYNTKVGVALQDGRRRVLIRICQISNIIAHFFITPNGIIKLPNDDMSIYLEASGTNDIFPNGSYLQLCLTKGRKRKRT